jgi:hypothetical protein
MTARVKSRLRLRILGVVSLAALLLIIGGTQASADPGQTGVKIAWSPCQKSPQTQLAPDLQGASETWQANFCIGWPVKPVNPPRALDVRGVSTLIIHAVHDPSLHYSWAHGLVAQIDGSALLTRTGDGHTSISDCARAAADAFLIERRSEANRMCEG